MNRISQLLLCALTLSAPTFADSPPPQTLPIAATPNHAAVDETREERDARMAWWRDAKFGMFIHYGLYSGLAGEFRGVPGGAEWIQKNLELDTDTYAAEAAPLFKPRPAAPRLGPSWPRRPAAATWCSPPSTTRVSPC